MGSVRDARLRHDPLDCAGQGPLATARALSPLDVQIVRLVASGTSTTAIGRYVNLSTDAVTKRIRRINATLGTRRRDHTAAMGVLLGVVTAADVSGLPRVRPELDPRDAAVLYLTVSGRTAKQIAHFLGRSYGSIHHSRLRLSEAFNARGTAQVAAAAVLLDAVTAHMVDRRLPEVPLSALRLPCVGVAS